MDSYRRSICNSSNCNNERKTQHRDHTSLNQTLTVYFLEINSSVNNISSNCVIVIRFVCTELGITPAKE